MRIVLDTNVLARATPGKTGPASVLRQVIHSSHLLILSPYLLTELARVLRYPRVQAMHGLDDREMDQYLAALQAGSLIVNVSPYLAEQIVPDDPDDDPIVATAIAGKANYLCTLDKHLLCQEVVDYCAGHEVRVLTDTELLRELRNPA